MEQIEGQVNETVFLLVHMASSRHWQRIAVTVHGVKDAVASLKCAKTLHGALDA